MRILHVIPAIAPRYGGPSAAVVGMCRALKESGTDILIVTSDGDGPTRLAVPLGEAQPYSGVPTIFFKRWWSDKLHVTPDLARWVNRCVSSFDVVHIHAVFSHAGPVTAAACRRFGVPFVVRPLGNLDPWSLRQSRLQKQIAWRLWSGPMLRHAAAVHYTTAEEKRLVETTLGLQRGVVIGLGVDEKILAATDASAQFRSHFLQSTQNPYVLFLARLHPKKNLEALIDAFVSVTEAEPLGNWRLVIAGDGEPDYVKSLTARVEARRATGRVVFTGWLAGDDRTGALQGAALMVLASRQENFGLSVMESLACSVPVLVSREVNLADEIAQARCGWIVELDGPQLETALREALVDADERVRRGNAGRELARSRYTWPAVARRLNELYQSLASKPG